MEKAVRSWKDVWITAVVLTIVAITATWALGSMVITSNTTLTTDLSFSGDGIIIQGNNITLDGAGHTISGPGAVWANGVTSSGNSGITVKNLNITGFAQGIAMSNGSGNVIENCQIDAGSALQGNGSGGTVAGTGVLLQTTSNSTLYSNTISDFWRNIFMLYGSDGNSVLENTLTRTFSIQTLSHIQLHESGSNEIIGNTISGTANNGVVLLLYCDENRIEGNTLSGGMGLALGMSGYNTLPVDNSDNVFEDNAISGPWSAIQVSYLNAGATGNIFRGNMATGLILEGAFLFNVANGVTIEGNYLEGTEPSGYSTRGFNLNNTQGTELRENIVANFKCGLIANGSVENKIVFNDFQASDGSVGLTADSLDNVFYGNLPDPLIACSGREPAPDQLTACDLIPFVADIIDNSDIHDGIKKSLLEKLRNLYGSCIKRFHKAVKGKIKSILNEIKAQLNKKISADDADKTTRVLDDVEQLLE